MRVCVQHGVKIEASAFQTQLSGGVVVAGRLRAAVRSLIYGGVSSSGRGLNPQISAPLNHCTVEPGGRAE